MIPSALMISNGKGGVLKTSLAANLAGLAALSGWRVLAVDLDPQGNLATDLGVLDKSDGGEGLLRAVADNARLTPLAHRGEVHVRAADLRPGDSDLRVGSGVADRRRGHPHPAPYRERGHKALQDALALERACQEHDSWDEALAAYDRERCSPGNELVELGRRLGRAQVEETPDWTSMTAADFDGRMRGEEVPVPEGDFDMWSEEMADRPPARTPEELLLRLDRLVYVEGGFTALADAEPCFFCGRPTKSQDPQGVIRHPVCPMSPEEEARVRQVEAGRGRLLAERDAPDKMKALLERIHRRGQ